ncbi:MAG: hypothetical protein KDE19_21665 [Caldilineaceae bacterium]|nr:hypothetical protein [Caldilineaceae bacterium]
MSIRIDGLLEYLFDGQPHLLAESMATWLASSRRFVDFVDTFRDKIRKKLRTTVEAETQLDLQLELETAYLLLQERTLHVEYEPLPPRQARSPDFAVTYTTSLTLMVEVTRLRAGTFDPLAEVVTPRIDGRLIDSICGKLGQLLPQTCNVLLIGTEALPVTQGELHATLLEIQQRAERNDHAFLRRHRFRDRAAFFRCYQRVSEILVRGATVPATEPLVTWTNPQAKHLLPSKVRTALYRSQTV